MGIMNEVEERRSESVEEGFTGDRFTSAGLGNPFHYLINELIQG